MRRVSFGLWAVGVAVLLVACGGGGVPGPSALTVSPASGAPGTPLVISGLPLDVGGMAGLEVWVGDRQAPVVLEGDGSLRSVVPLFFAGGDWPEAPGGAQALEVRRNGQVLGRSVAGIGVMALPRAPGTSRAAYASLSAIAERFESLLLALPFGSVEEGLARDGVIAMLNGVLHVDPNSLRAVLEGTAPLLGGSSGEPELIDALLASSGAASYLEEYARQFAGSAVDAQARVLALAGLCDGEGPDVELACRLQIASVLDQFTRSVVSPTATSYANIVGTTVGLVGTTGYKVPADMIVGALLGVADFVMSKVVPALLPSRLSRFDLLMPEVVIEVGESTQSSIVVAATNDPPPLSVRDVILLVLSVAGLADMETKMVDTYKDMLTNIARFTFETYAKFFPKEAPDIEVRIPAMTWGPVVVTHGRLVDLFSYDTSVVVPDVEALEWTGVKLGEATVRVMPKGPGSESKVLRDSALCLGCAYHGGAFGDEMPAAQKLVIVGGVELTAMPYSGRAPLTTVLSWSGLVPQDEPVVCTLDPGDGSVPYVIPDCAVTTSTSHVYAYASNLANDLGVYRAVLAIEGTSKTASTEVLPEWTFSATPSSGEAPLAVAFGWGGFDPGEGPYVCTLDPGDGTPVKAFSNCLTTTSATHRYGSRGSFVPNLTVTNARGQSVKTTAVTVSEQSDCSGIMNVPAWKGSISYAHSRDVEGDGKHVIYSYTVDISATLHEEYRTENSVGYFAGVIEGHVAVTSEDHSHGESHHVDRTFQGSGTPIPYRVADGTGSRMIFRVGADCHYLFYSGGFVAGSGTFFGQPTQTGGGYGALQAKYYDASLANKGSLPLPLRTIDDIHGVHPGPDLWFLEDGFVARILGKENLGTVVVTWSFEPAE